MRKVLKHVSFVILLLKICIVFGQINDVKKIIMIDPGHGGKDSGAIGINGIQEKDVAFDIALEILKLNEQFEEPLDIYITRYSDTLTSLSDRTNLAKVLKADLFVSLHCNHSNNPNARGIEVYVSKRRTGYSAESVWLAFNLQVALYEQLGFESRGVKFADFQVLRETIDFAPGVLLELGFLSNWDERKYYQKPESYQVLALLILESIIEKLEL